MLVRAAGYWRCCVLGYLCTNQANSNIHLEQLTKFLAYLPPPYYIPYMGFIWVHIHFITGAFGGTLVRAVCPVSSGLAVTLVVYLPPGGP